MDVQKERKSTFLLRLNIGKKDLSLFAAQYLYRTCL